MTPYPILNFIIWAFAVLLVIVLFIAVLVWAVNKLDADAAAALIVWLFGPFTVGQ